MVRGHDMNRRYLFALWARKVRRELSPSQLALAALLFLSFLAAEPAPAASDSDSFFTHLHTEKAMANVTISPGRAGPVDIIIQLETVDELPLTAKAVSVTLRDARNREAIARRFRLRAAATISGTFGPR